MKVIRESSEGHQRHIRKSSAGYQGVIRGSSEGYQVVTKKSSKIYLVVISNTHSSEIILVSSVISKTILSPYNFFSLLFFSSTSPLYSCCSSSLHEYVTKCFQSQESATDSSTGGTFRCLKTFCHIFV